MCKDLRERLAGKIQNNVFQLLILLSVFTGKFKNCTMAINRRYLEWCKALVYNV